MTVINDCNKKSLRNWMMESDKGQKAREQLSKQP